MTTGKEKIKVYFGDTELTEVGNFNLYSGEIADSLPPIELKHYTNEFTVAGDTAVLEQWATPQPTTIQLASGRHWFSEKRETEAVLTSTRQAGSGVSMDWEGVPGTQKDLTDYSIRARSMRWLYDNSSIFHWAYNKYTAERGEQ